MNRVASEQSFLSSVIIRLTVTKQSSSYTTVQPQIFVYIYTRTQGDMKINVGYDISRGIVLYLISQYLSKSPDTVLWNKTSVWKISSDTHAVNLRATQVGAAAGPKMNPIQLSASSITGGFSAEDGPFLSL